MLDWVAGLTRNFVAEINPQNDNGGVDLTHPSMVTDAPLFSLGAKRFETLSN